MVSLIYKSQGLFGTAELARVGCWRGPEATACGLADGTRERACCFHYDLYFLFFLDTCRELYMMYECI
jgi:hypothetical protein